MSTETQSDQDQVNRTFFGMVAGIKHDNGITDDEIQSNQNLQNPDELDPVVADEGLGYPTEEDLRELERIDDEQVDPSENENDFFEFAEAQFGEVPEDETDISDDAALIIEKLGSTTSATPSHEGVVEVDDSDKVEVRDNLGDKVVRAMVAGSEDDDRFARATLREMYTDPTDAIDRPTYLALDSLHTIAMELEQLHAEPDFAAIILGQEVDRQIAITFRPNGQGRPARLMIEAMAAQLARRIAPGSGLHKSLIQDGQKTAARISNGILET